MRSHLRMTLVDTSNAIIHGASVAVYQPGTTTPLVQTPMSDATTYSPISNPFVCADGVVDFYLAGDQRVDLGVTPVDQSEIIFANIDVLGGGGMVVAQFLQSGSLVVPAANVSNVIWQLGDPTTYSIPGSGVIGDYFGVDVSGLSIYLGSANAPGFYSAQFYGEVGGSGSADIQLGDSEGDLVGEGIQAWGNRTSVFNQVSISVPPWAYAGGGANYAVQMTASSATMTLTNGILTVCYHGAWSGQGVSA